MSNTSMISLWWASNWRIAGRDISADMFADALKKHLNVQWDFWWVVADTAIKAVKPGAKKIDLHDLAFHNGIQHDAALTRNDRGQGQYFTRVNMTLVKQLLVSQLFIFFSEISGEISEKILIVFQQMNNGKPLSYLHMARARRLREGQSEAWNKNYTLPGQQSSSISENKWFLAIDQAAVPLLVLSDNVPGEKKNTGVVPVDRLLTFFQYERLPYENGWVPSQYELSGQQIFDGIRKVTDLYKNGPDVVQSPIGLRLTDTGPTYNPHPDYWPIKQLLSLFFQFWSSLGKVVDSNRFFTLKLMLSIGSIARCVCTKWKISLHCVIGKNALRPHPLCMTYFPLRCHLRIFREFFFVPDTCFPIS